MVWSVDGQNFPSMIGGHADERRHAGFRKGDDFAVLVDEDAGALAFSSPGVLPTSGLMVETIGFSVLSLAIMPLPLWFGSQAWALNYRSYAP